MHERLRKALLGHWGRFVALHPGMTLLVCLVLAVFCLILAAARLQFRSDRSDLVDPNLSWNKAYSQYKLLNPRWDDLTVCIDGPAGEGRVDDLARRIADHVVKDQRILAADAGFDIAQTGPRLFAVAPGTLFERALADLERAKRLSAAENSNAALAVALASLASQREDEEALDDLETFLRPYLEALSANGSRPDFSFIRPDQSRWQPLVSEIGSGRLRFLQVRFDKTDGGIDAESENLAWLRQEVGRIIEADDLRDEIEWGITGIPAIEADETKQSIHDSTVASVIALILITSLMLLVFRGFVVPLLAAGSLLIGLALSFGWLVLAVGHLQLLSVVFSVILLGLGIDFALHLVARLELVQHEHEHLHTAMARVFRGIGPGMLTGAVTTAAAFGATALTDFKGMAEMGIIAGGGILLCLAAMLCAFPAALALTGRWKKIIRHRPGGELAHFAHGRLDSVDRRPRHTLFLAGIAVLLLAIGATRVKYDPNVLNLQPPGVESVEWEKRIVEDDARSVWAGLVLVAPERAEDMVDRLRALPEVSDVGAMGLLFPPDRVERSLRIARLRDQPNPPLASDPSLSALEAQLGGVSVFLEREAKSADDDAGRRLLSLAGRIRAATTISAGLSPLARAEREAVLDEAFSTAREALSRWLSLALAPGPPGPEDLPPFLRTQWAPAQDKWVLRVYPADDRPAGRSILHPARLGPFVKAVRSVEEGVIGPPVQIHESSELIKREYTKAACYAVAAILILLMLDFRSVADALCAMLPVSIGFVGVFGMLGLSNMPLNFANIIVMPLIFGIGVDAGVHMVHRWRQQPYGRPAGLSGATGRGITLTMLTTMIGFGCMLIAEHRGIRSLGFVMVVGLAVTLAGCYLVLPAVLRLRAAAPTEALR
ncbi:MAG: MMPL family transporter [Phycisphaerales bacterium]|nr:MAG: MMPL family transporter [Phycisphaerales bacterium]